MRSTSLIRCLVRRWSRSDDPGQTLPPAEMQRLLQRERARADRTQSPLSVLVYSCGKDCEAAAPLGRVLRQRLRNTDEVGWVAPGHLCVVLPDTPAAGAWKVADDVARSLLPYLTVPTCTVYTYPDQPNRLRLKSRGQSAGTDHDGRPVQAEREYLAPLAAPPAEG